MTRAFKVGEIVLIENPNNRLYWPLGKIIELIPKRDREVRILKLSCCNSESSILSREFFHWKFNMLKRQESNDVPFDAEALEILSANVDVSESAMILVDAPLICLRSRNMDVLSRDLGD
ncbi:hypothetical protein TNCV_3118501 [Trichonephila clavipes]|uniref:DUF5641 domain-containing protein n=1 Tax=Trichonephila clavipes TaxID=2585209 RepID=A0A8X7BGQ6_TRICX|nr:hypothetical protein TNCV_3118501 [Trichonephila clavipes]